MSQSAFFINVGRGKTVDEAALIKALQAGEIAGAGLDVFEEEPLPPHSPLWEMDNVVLTAHYGGITPIATERLLSAFLANLERLQSGLPLKNAVDWKRGY